MLLAIGSSLHNFFPALVNTLGFPTSTTLGLTAPPYVVAAAAAIAAAYSADRYRNASFFIIGCASVASIGFLMFLFEQSASKKGIWVRYTSTYLMLAGSLAANPVVHGWVQKTVRQPKEMRAVAIAFINAAGGISQILTAQLYPNKWAPRYIQSMSLNVGAAIVAILLVVFMREMLRRANNVLDREEDNIRIEMLASVITDEDGAVELPAVAQSFRYTL